jgi:hypothetical protein
VDQEVAKTLGELELKLQELERELTSLDRHDAPRDQSDTLSGQGSAPGRLIDEVVERNRASDSDTEERVAEEAVADGDGFGGPAVWGGEEVPAQAGATIERDWTVEVRETAYGEIPIPPPQAPDPPSARAPQHLPSAQHVPGSPHLPGTPGAQHAAGPPYAPPPPTHPFLHSPPSLDDQTIDVADLERFRDKLTSATNELVDEYNRLLSRMRSRRQSES